MLRSRSITGQLFLFALAFGGPLLLLSGFIGWQYVRQEERRIENLAITQAASVAAQIDNQLATFLASLNVISVGASVVNGNADDIRARLDQIDIPDTVWFTLRDRNGRQLLNTAVPAGQPLPTFSGKGDPVLFEQGQRYVSNLIWAPMAKTWAVTVNVPVRSPPVTGEVKYAITAAIPSEYFVDLLTRAAPAGWVVTINDRDGYILARSQSHAEFVGKPMARQGWELSKDTPPGGAGLWHNIRNLEGVLVRGAFQRMSSTGWLIGVTALPEVYRAPQRDTILVGLALVALALLLAVALATLMGRRITKAIDALQTKAMAMREMKVIDLPKTSLQEVNAVAAILRDTTHVLREREEQQTTLIQELNHRVKNTLATIQSISRLTLRNTPDPVSFERAFSERLLALSNTHNLLTDSAWEGVDLRELLATELKPFLTSPRVMLKGPAVTLTSKVAVALGMAVHELATNAIKYGALHEGDGSIRITWSVAADILTLDWRERCGREIQPPTKLGFGTRLIKQTIVRELQGQVEQTFLRDGLHLTLRVPLRVSDRLSA